MTRSCGLHWRMLKGMDWPDLMSFITERADGELPSDVVRLQGADQQGHQVMLTSQGDMISEADSGGVTLLASSVDYDFAFAVYSTLSARSQLASLTGSETSRIMLESYVAEALGVPEAERAAYTQQMQERRARAQAVIAEAQRASFQIVSAQDLPPAIESDQLQRWDDTSYSSVNWKRVNEIASQYLSGGGDPLDPSACRNWAREQGVDDEEVAWASSLFSESIRYPVDQPELFSNGRHRTLAMRQQGAEKIVVELENMPQRKEAYLYAAHISAGVAYTRRPVLEALDSAEMPSPVEPSHHASIAP